MWNELRERLTTQARKQELVGEMLGLMRGRVMDVAMRHDTSRAVQGCLKHGTAAQKDEMCGELFGHVLELSKIKHGHQHVTKMLTYGSNDTRRKVAAELKGNIARLMTHALGALVVESGFTSAWSPGTCWGLFQEMYGPEYVNFKMGPDVKKRSMAGLLESNPSARKGVLESVFFTLSRAVDKNLLSLSVIQRLLCEYMLAAPPEAVVTVLAVVKDQLLSLVASKQGARAAALCFAYGTAKERKQMLKGLKGHMLDVACHLHGHMVLVAALSFADDTKATYTAIFSELSPHLAYLACHKFGKQVILALLAPSSPRYFDAYSLEMLKPVTLPAYLAKRKDKVGEGEEGGEGGVSKPPKVVAGDAGVAALAASIAPAAPAVVRVLPVGPTVEQLADSGLVACSKKDEVSRRAELLAALRPAMESVCLTRASLLARSKYGALVMYEAALALGALPVAAGKKGKGGCAPAAPVASGPAPPSTSILEAIADLLTSEASPEEISAQVAEMEKGAKEASAGSSGTRSGVPLPESGPAVAKAGQEGKPKEAVHMVVADEEMPDAVAEEEEEDGVRALPRDGGSKSEQLAGFLDSDDDEGAPEAHEASAYGAGEVMLPILEHAPSHLLFKRLLAREAAQREDARPVKAGKEEGAQGPPVFGPLLLARAAGSLASLTDSNRAAFVVLELSSSRDAATAEGARAELKKGQAQWVKGKAATTPGVQVLAKLLGLGAGVPAKPSGPGVQGKRK
jgi:pumilio family protein 6